MIPPVRLWGGLQWQKLFVVFWGCWSNWNRLIMRSKSSDAQIEKFWSFLKSPLFYITIIGCASYFQPIFWSHGYSMKQSSPIDLIGTLSKEDYDGSENDGKNMNLRSFKLNGVYLDPLNMSNAGDFSWSWILKDFIQAQKDKGKFVVVCPRPP